MSIQTTAMEWTKFIGEPWGDAETYSQEVRVEVHGVVLDDEAFDVTQFATMHPDEPVIIRGGTVCTSTQDTDLTEVFQNWRRTQSIPTSSMVMLDIPEERMETFMKLMRKHGYTDFIIETPVEAPRETPNTTGDFPTP